MQHHTFDFHHKPPTFVNFKRLFACTDKSPDNLYLRRRPLYTTKPTPPLRGFFPDFDQLNVLDVRDTKSQHKTLFQYK